MSYQKKNNRAAREGEGRPTEYRPEYCQEIIKYFSVEPFTEKMVAKTTGKNEYEREEFKEVANPLPFFTAFARKIGVTHDTLLEWVKVHPEFSVSFTRARQLQQEMLHINSLKGLYDSKYAVFTAKNITDWRDKTEIEHVVEMVDREKSVPALKNRLAELLNS